MNDRTNKRWNEWQNDGWKRVLDTLFVERLRDGFVWESRLLWGHGPSDLRWTPVHLCCCFLYLQRRLTEHLESLGLVSGQCLASPPACLSYDFASSVKPFSISNEVSRWKGQKTFTQLQPYFTWERKRVRVSKRETTDQTALPWQSSPHSRVNIKYLQVW